MSLIKLNCKACGRHLGEAEAIIAELLCPNSACRASTQFKIINNDIAAMMKYKFANPEREPKKKGKTNE